MPTYRTMTPRELRSARQTVSERLDLTLREFADIMDTDDRAVRAYESPKDGSKESPPRYERLLLAYLAGFDPPDLD